MTNNQLLALICVFIITLMHNLSHGQTFADMEYCVKMAVASIATFIIVFKLVK